MATFDAPNREVCTVRRGRTNTPLQALVTLNDPVYIEAAQSLARRMIAAADDIESRLEFGVRTCLLRDPTPKESERLNALYEQTLKEFRTETAEAKLLAEDPLGPVPKEMDVADAAAMTVIGNVLLNLDEMFLKR